LPTKSTAHEPSRHGGPRRGDTDKNPCRHAASTAQYRRAQDHRGDFVPARTVAIACFDRGCVTAKDANGNPAPDWIYLLYDQSDRSWSDFTHFPFVKYGLGADTTLGTWRTFRRDLAADLYNATGKSIVSVLSMRVYANGSISNVRLWGNGVRSSGY